jgi:prepilin-type processing-associated H-X9-DG protein
MCRCADCTAARAMDKALTAGDGLAITEIETVGSYAINIAFSDGHARGIYPWELLKTLGKT